VLLILPGASARDCRWTRRLVPTYVDNDADAVLSSRDLARIEGHLLRCDRCRTVVHDLVVVSSRLRSFGRRTALSAAEERLVLWSRRRFVVRQQHEEEPS